MNYETVEDLQSIIQDSVKASTKLSSKIPSEIENIRGMSTPSIRHFLNQVCSYGPCKYLEIGVWAGSTLIPALYKNQVEAVAIDNWSQFVPEEVGGFNAREALNALLMRYGTDIHRYHLVNADCFSEDAIALGNEPFNVFLYDGNHDAPSTQKAIEIYGKNCHKPFILIVDDWSLTPTVAEGTEKALESFNVHWSIELKKEDGYHEGVKIYILEAQ